MDKVFNWISVAGGVIGGTISGLFGGFDGVLYALIVLMVLDYISGLIKAYCNKNLSSSIGFKGILKKMLILVMVAAAVALEEFLGDGLALREIVIVFYACNEGLSILENTAAFLPYPQKVKEVLEQLRSRGDK